MTTGGGKPTLHRQFSENIAVLAGDALNAIAFGLLARAGDTHLTTILAEAIGTLGMIGGQVADVEAEGRDVSKDEVHYIHTHKTAALIAAACKMGGYMGGADENDLEILHQYGQNIGIAFQIVDDILDVVGDETVLGKDVGSDAGKQKASYPSVFGLERSHELASEYTEKGIKVLDDLSVEKDSLRSLAQFVIRRTY